MMNYTRDIAFNVEDYIGIVISTTAEWLHQIGEKIFRPFFYFI